MDFVPLYIRMFLLFKIKHIVCLAGLDAPCAPGEVVMARVRRAKVGAKVIFMGQGHFRHNGAWACACHPHWISDYILDVRFRGYSGKWIPFNTHLEFSWSTTNKTHSVRFFQYIAPFLDCFPTMQCPQPPRPAHYHGVLLRPPVSWTQEQQQNVDDARVEPGRLCEKCEQLRSLMKSILIVADNNQLTAQHDDNTSSSTSVDFAHYGSGAELEKSAKDGCHLCTQIWIIARNPDVDAIVEGGSKFPESHSETLRNGSHVSVKLIWSPNKLSSHGADVKLLLLPGIRLNDTGYWTQDEKIYLRLRGVDRAPRTLALARRQNFTSSSRSFDLLKQWIQQCIRSHPTCRDTLSAKLPTRLLHVSRAAGHVEGAHIIRLVDTSSLTQPVSRGLRYAALSYCWGQGPSFKLEQATRPELYTGVDATLLPRTIQDAVLVTESLGLEWLWIDSMCIVQDSKEDWEREAGTMEDVYKGCFIALVALAAESSNGGLFAQRDPLIYHRCYMFDHDASTSYYLDTFSTVVGPLAGYVWPLQKRAWTFQERILPPRAAQFGPYLGWECRELKMDEFELEEPMTAEYPNAGHFVDSLMCQRFYAIASPDSTARMTDNQIYDTWLMARAFYSAASLTHMTDRLIAVSGFIMAIQRATGWESKAGIWRQFVHQDLLWIYYNYLDEQRSSRRSGLFPTWSWVSITGEVFGIGVDSLEPSKHVAEVSFLDVERSKNISVSDTKHLKIQINCYPLGILPSQAPEEIRLDGLHRENEAIKVDVHPDIVQERKTPTHFLPLCKTTGMCMDCL